MIRAGLCGLAMLALGACEPNGTGARNEHDRQQPSATEPGVTVSGYARVGVIRKF